MSTAIETSGAGCRFGRIWALRDCTLALPAGSITAVVGPNGAGKTTLLNLLVGLLPPSEGQLRVVGHQPSSKPDFLARVGFVAQDCPLYGEFSVVDLLRFGRAMNPSWDEALARSRLAAAEVPLGRRAGKLSGGQRAQVALALAVAKRPQVLLLDEPLAALDPLARRQFLKTLVDSAIVTGITVVMSSHLIGELARVSDHLIVIRGGRVCLSGDLDQVIAEHHWVAGSPDEITRLPGSVEVVTESRHERHTTRLIRTSQPLLNPAFTMTRVDLEELVLAYLESPNRTTNGVPSWEAARR
ncbi:MAG: ABC transporter ATP-binding protein [Actinomycetota bacterium]|nr:ABC transporter ATP-binding protein [Actinomycetota bacterium]